MKKKPTKLLLVLSLIIITGSCNTSQISLSVLQPATIQLPANVQRVSVLPVPGKYSTDYDSLQYLHAENDSIVWEVKMGYIHGIYDVMRQSPRYEKVVLTEDKQGKFRKKIVFSFDQLRKVCAQDSTDVVLILTKCISRDFFSEWSGNIIGDYIVHEYILINHTEWSFFSPFLETEVAKLVFNDTAKVAGGFVKDGFDDIFYDVCYSIGQRIGLKISPFWIDNERVFYSGPGKDLKDAAHFVAKGHWYKASLLWNELVEETDPVKASRAAHNIALAFERDDDLNQALLWITYADSLAEIKYTREYKAVLEKRMLKKATLDLQILGN